MGNLAALMITEAIGIIDGAEIFLNKIRPAKIQSTISQTAKIHTVLYQV